MFIVEYRTKSSFGVVYPSRFLNVGAHHAQSIEDAKRKATSRLGQNVEIIGAVYCGSL